MSANNSACVYLSVILSLVVSGCSNNLDSLKWPPNIQSLILLSSDIAIVEVYGVPGGATDPTNAIFRASARLVKSLKGGVPPMFILNSYSSYGETGFCMATPLHNQQYLAFLIKDKTEYRPANPYGLIYNTNGRADGAALTRENFPWSWAGIIDYVNRAVGGLASSNGASSKNVIENGRPCEGRGMLVSDYEAKVKQNPISTLNWYRLGEAQMMSGSQVDAIASFARAVDLNPQFRSAWYRLGILYLTRDPKKSTECLKKAVNLDPKFKKAWELLVIAYQSSNDHQHAVEAFEKTRVLGSADGNLMAIAIISYIKEQRRQDAHNVYLQLYKLDQEKAKEVEALFSD